MRPSLKYNLLFNLNKKVTPLLLDVIAGAYAGFSVTRKLRAGYTGKAFQVTRSNDNSTLDIGFLANGLTDVASLTSFVGSNTGYLTKLYDQVSSNNFVQSNTALAPKIIINGTLQTVNGLPAWKQDTTGQLLSCNLPLTAFGSGNGSILHVFWPLAAAVESATSGRLYDIVQLSTTAHSTIISSGTLKPNFSLDYYTHSMTCNALLMNTKNYLMLDTWNYSAAAANCYVNNLLSGAANQTLAYNSPNSCPCSLGGSIGFSKTYNGYMQEFITFKSLVDYTQLGAWYNSFYNIV